MFRLTENPHRYRWLRLGLFLLVCAAIGLLKFRFHELWKDEWQAWMLARDLGWGELLANLYYEGHPALWYIYLKFWTYPGVSNEAQLIQLAHFIPVVASKFLLFRFVRLRWWLVLLIALGYYPLFEYGMVNRGYAFLMLLAFLLPVLKRGSTKPWIVAIALFLLCQTEVFGVIMAGSWLLYRWLERGGNPFGDRSWLTEFIGAVAGVLIFVITVFPRGGEEELSRAYLDEPLSAEVLATAFQGTSANTYWIGIIPDTNVFGVSAAGIILSIILIAGMLYFFYGKRPAFYAFLAFQVVFFLFAAVIYTGGVRQWGVGVIFLISLIAIIAAGEEWRVKWPRFVILLSVLGCQLYYSGMAISKEIKYPFSHAKEAGEFIKEKVPEKVPVLAMSKFETTPVVGYADRPFYTLPYGEPFTYFKWVEKVYVPTQKEMKLFARYKGTGGIAIISHEPLSQQKYPQAQLWKSFEGFNLKNESYYLYLLER